MHLGVQSISAAGAAAVATTATPVAAGCIGLAATKATAMTMAPVTAAMQGRNQLLQDSQKRDQCKRTIVDHGTRNALKTKIEALIGRLSLNAPKPKLQLSPGVVG